jgi:Zn-dependent protease with chaperone function
MSTSESADALTTDVRSEWTGFYYDGFTAAKRPVVVTVRPGGLQVDVDDKRARFWPFHDLRQTQGWLPGEQLRIEVGGEHPQAIIINEPGLPEAIRKRGGQIDRSIRSRTRTTKILGTMAAIIVGMAVLYYWLAPVVADRVAMRVPAAWEVKLGESAEARLAPLGQQCTDPAGLAGLRSIMTRLTDAQPASPYKFRIVALRDSSVNAFAAPGGLIAVNEGLLRDARSPEEIAGVLAHEIQHVNRRHSTRGILRELPMRFAISALGVGSVMESAAATATTLGALSYRRDDESEADREGVNLLRAARVDAAPAADFIERLEKSGATASGLERYLSTHPASQERAVELRRLAATQSGETSPIIDAGTFAAVKNICQR